MARPSSSPAVSSPATDLTWRDGWLQRLTGPLAAGVVLVLFWVGLLASLGNKSITYDEIGHVTAGYTYWKYGDFRLDPENGNLPQRLMAAPLVLGGEQFGFPPAEAAGWATTDVWSLGRRWFHEMGHDIRAMLARGRAAMGLVAVALGLLVWSWSRRLFGPIGGMLSLVLYCLSPIVLANGALMTSDTMSALAFLAAAGSLWRALHRITPDRILVAGLYLGGLCISKMSAALIGPMALIMIVARLCTGRPLEIALGAGWSRLVASRGRQVLALTAAGLAQALIAWIVLWGAYDFRYSAFAPGAPPPAQFQHSWPMVLGALEPLYEAGELTLTASQRAQLAELLKTGNVPTELWAAGRSEALEAVRREILSPEQNRQLDARLAEPPRSWPVRMEEFARRHRLLPEAFLYGQASTWHFARARFTFFNGDFNTDGSRWFFPYAFLVKTPLMVLAVFGLALAATWARRRLRLPLDPPEGTQRSGGRALSRSLEGQIERVKSAASWPTLYETLPLWALLAVYGTAALLARLNLGDRHLLPVYAPLIILAGAAGYWWVSTGRVQRVMAWVLTACVAGLVGEMAYRFPNYLPYFNALAGGPKQGYRHLIDSSLDWGQELPATKAYLDRHGAEGPFYLSYFGMDEPGYYGIAANRMYSAPGQDVPPLLFTLTIPSDRAEAIVANVQRQYPAYEVVGAIPEANNQSRIVMLKNARALRWSAGTYLISASMLQPVNYIATGPLGPWNARFEEAYQILARSVAPLWSEDQQVRLKALFEHSPADWENVLTRFESYRFARLTAFLRKREPDDNINFSILVYRLSDADLALALQGPPAELGRDLPVEIAERQAAEAKKARW